MSDLTGTQLGAYRIVEEIGRGGMAVVYKAYQPALDRHVAIKVLRQHLAEESDLVERFLREARAAAKLRHPSVIHIYDVGREGDWYYIVMDYIEGPSLAGKLKSDGALDVATALSIVRQIGSALDYAHGQGIVHRDVKPSNILLTGQGQAILSDFGIARAAAESRLTRTGTLVGTPEYMSPEQAEGQSMDGRSDVYSLGVVLYEMLAGRAPFRADTPAAVLYKQVHEAPPPLSEVQRGISPGVEAVVLRALAKDRRQRYQTAGEMVSALSQAEVGAGTGAHSGAAQGAEGARTAPIAEAPTVLRQPGPLTSRRNVHFYVMGAVLTALLVLAVLWSHGSGRRASLPRADTTTPSSSAIALASATTRPALAATSTAVPSRTSTGTATAAPRASHTATAVPVLAPTSTLIPSRTHTSTPTATHTPTRRPTPTKQQLLVNTGFEEDGGWQLVGACLPGYSDERVKNGRRSMRLGFSAGCPDMSYSSVAQRLTIPAEAIRAELSFWYDSEIGSPYGPRLFMQVYSCGESRLLDRLDVHDTSTRGWTQGSWPLTGLAGECVELMIGTFDDPWGETTVWVDDVELWVWMADR